MSAVTFELVGGPLDGQRVVLHEGSRYSFALTTNENPAVWLKPREANYRVGWRSVKRATTVEWELCLLYEGES